MVSKISSSKGMYSIASFSSFECLDFDLGDGATLECLADADNNIYNQDQELIGMLQCGKFVPMETMNRTHSGSNTTVAAAH